MAATVKRETLSVRDQEVLDSIFNPLELCTKLDESINSIDADTTCIDDNVEEDTAQLHESKALESQALQQAEAGYLQQALDTFAQALKATPQRASVFNNRAQALRLAGRDEDALSDLDKAIALSERQLRTKCHALCQRGVLRRKQEQLDAARIDFEEAAKLGSKFAKTQLVEINPYSALCNQMLRQAFEQLQQPN